MPDLDAAIMSELGSVVNKMVREGEKQSRKLLDYMIKKLKSMDNSAASRMAAWLQKGGQLASFTCQKDISKDMERLMVSHKIPFLSEEKDGFVLYSIRGCDKDKVRSLRLELQAMKEGSSRGTPEDVEEQARKMKQKMITFGGLKATEYEMIRNFHPNTGIYCDGMMNGRYAFTVLSGSILDNDPTKLDLAEAYTRSIIHLYGPNNQSFVKQMKIEAAFSEAMNKTNGFMDIIEQTDQPIYFVDGTNQNRLYKLSKDGICDVVPEKKDGKWKLREGDLVPLEADNFDDVFHRAVDSLGTPYYCNDMKKIMEYVKNGNTKEMLFEPGIDLRGREQNFIKGEEELSDQLVNIVKGHLLETLDPEKDASHAMNIMNSEISSLITQAARGGGAFKNPNGVQYTKEDMESIYKIAQDYKLSLGSYRGVSERLKDLEISSQTAKELKDRGFNHIGQAWEHAKQKNARDGKKWHQDNVR